MENYFFYFYKNILPMKKFTISLLVLTILASCSTLRNNKIRFSKANPAIENENVLTVERCNVRENTINKPVYSTDDNLSLESETNEQTFGIPSESKDEQCDKMLLRNGDDIEVKIVEIGLEEIKYKKCDNLEGPTISILKKDVFMITYPNGTKDVFKEEPKKETVVTKKEEVNLTPTPTEVNGMAVASLVLGLLGFVPLVGLILGVIANNQIKNNPRKYTGKGMATAGIVLSIIWLIILVIIFI